VNDASVVESDAADGDAVGEGRGVLEVKDEIVIVDDERLRRRDAQ
jgi:hypothetical protein